VCLPGNGDGELEVDLVGGEDVKRDNAKGRRENRGET